MSKKEFINDLVNETLLAVAEGQKKIVLWGIESNGLAVLSALNSMGMISFVSGLIDSSSAVQGRSFFGFLVQAPSDLPSIELDTLIVASDEGKESILDQFSRIDSRVPRIILSGQANYEFDDPVYQHILSSCPVKSKAGGYQHMLVHLYQSLRYVATRNLYGSIAEFGVYQGGTTVFMAKVLQHYGCTGRIYGFDTFAGFPQRKSALDIYRDQKCEFPDFETVRRYCSPYNIELVQGDICETYTKLHDIPLVMSFFDTDNYSPTRRALELCIKQTVEGGILAFDHYYSPNWNKTVGERIAIKQVLDESQTFNLHGTGIFVKI
jgi:O-methyltransferase